MDRVVLDADLRAKLHGRKKGVAFTDDQGNVVGYFVSHDSFDRLASALLPPATKEELAEARAEMLARGGVSTAEILEAIATAKREWDARQ